MTTNSQVQPTSCNGVLHVSFELSAKSWKLGFADRLGRRARVRTVRPGDLPELRVEIAKAKRAFGLQSDAKVISAYEAGRDGFWLHRCLIAMGIESYIVEPASIQVTRKSRRAKTDRIDAEKIVAALMRYLAGDRFACSMIRVPDEESEDIRNLNREMVTIKKERTALSNRIGSLLVTQGIPLGVVDRNFPKKLVEMRTPEGKPLGQHLRARLLREFERLVLATEQIRVLEMEQAKMLRVAAKEATKCEAAAKSPKAVIIAEQFMNLVGIGPVTAWTLSSEIFAWRDIANRRQLAALAGLTPTPHDSGDDEKEQGISKSGRGQLRVLLIEIAWGWLIHQPTSALSKWYAERFNDGTKRNRKIGIVALARKLLVALGKYIRGGEIPLGAKVKEQRKFDYTPSLKPRPATATV